MREAYLERLLVRAVSAAGGICLKLPAMFYRGVPDRLVLLPGARIYFVELKADDGHPSSHQLRFIKFLRGLGFWADIIKGKDQLKEFIQHHVDH